jgi:hypothetical protein
MVRVGGDDEGLSVAQSVEDTYEIVDSRDRHFISVRTIYFSRHLELVSHSKSHAYFDTDTQV